jgi:hypothetical protein
MLHVNDITAYYNASRFNAWMILEEFLGSASLGALVEF